MKRRRVSRRALAGGAFALLVALVVGVVLVPDLRSRGPGASPGTLNRIAGKNDKAAIEAAARMRAESIASARAADALRRAEERGRAEADATLARLGNEDLGDNAAAPANLQ